MTYIVELSLFLFPKLSFCAIIQELYYGQTFPNEDEI